MIDVDTRYTTSTATDISYVYVPLISSTRDPQLLRLGKFRSFVRPLLRWKILSLGYMCPAYDEAQILRCKFVQAALHR